MKQPKFTVAAVLAALTPGAVMAHSDAIGQSVIHNLTHALQSVLWLPAMLLTAIVTLVFISRTNKRES